LTDQSRAVAGQITLTFSFLNLSQDNCGASSSSPSRPRASALSIGWHRNNIGLRAGPGLTLMMDLIYQERLLSVAGTMSSGSRTTTEGMFSESASNLSLQSVGARRDVNVEVSNTEGPIAGPSLHEAQCTNLDQRGLSADSEDRLLKAKEIQRELGVSRATAYRMMTDGTLPAYRFGGVKGRRVMVRVSLRDLRRWLANHRGGTAQEPTC